MTRTEWVIYLGSVAALTTAVWFTRGPIQLVLFILECVFFIAFCTWQGKRKDKNNGQA